MAARWQTRRTIHAVRSTEPLSSLPARRPGSNRRLLIPSQLSAVYLPVRLSGCLSLPVWLRLSE
eukprot:COSAG06_NODE_5301_length_3575_cov_9.623705_3_plen_64_part_00